MTSILTKNIMNRSFYFEINKKAVLLNFIIIALFCSCTASSQPYTLHSPISLSSVSNKTISGYSITGGSKPAILLNNCHDIHITKNLLQNSTASSGIIYLNNCYNIYIDTNLIKNGIRGIFAVNCKDNIRIIYNKILNTADPNISSNGGGSAIQLNKCNGAGIRIDSNYVYEPIPNINIGDKISLYQCNGTSSSYIRIYYNNLRGGSTNPAGYAGIVLGDSGYSSYQDAQYNTLCNTGNAGMVIGGGQHMIVNNNRIYSAFFTVSAAGIMFFNNSRQYATYQAPEDINVNNNVINWSNFQNKIDNYWFDPKAGIAPNSAGNTQPGKGDYTITNEILPDPLF
jgi:hypothetical protein